MVRKRLLPDFVLSNGDGSERPLHEFLIDFNILPFRHDESDEAVPSAVLLKIPLPVKHTRAL